MMLDSIQHLSSLTYPIAMFLVNYWIHSTLFVCLALVALKLNWIKSDSCGEILLKVVLLLGLFSASLVHVRPQDSNVIFNVSVQSAKEESLWGISQSADTQKTDASGAQRSLSLRQKQLKLDTSVPPSGAFTPSVALDKQVLSYQKEDLAVQSNKLPEVTLLTSNNILMLSGWLMFSYLCGVVLMMVVRMYQYLQLSRLMAHNEPLLDVVLLSGLASLKAKAGVKDDVRLYSTDVLTSPIVLNQREIILPDVFVTRYSSQQQQAALAHELAHIKRNDVAWQKVFVLFDILFFFQPLNRMLRKKLNQMVEQRADDMASQWTRNPKALAQALSVAAQQQLGNRHSQWVLAMKCEKSNLLLRVENLLKEGAEKTRIYAIVGLSMLFSAIAIAGPGVTTSASASYTAAEPKQALATTSVKPSRLDTNKQSKLHHSFSFQEIEDDHGVGQITISHSTDDTHWKLSSELKGKIRFNDEETKILYFPENSELEVKIDDGRDKRRLLISRDNGETEYRYYLNRKKRDIAEDPQWMAQFIPQLLRATGWNAQERVHKIYAKGGLNAVLDEIALMTAEHAKAKYLMLIPHLQVLVTQDINQVFEATAVIRSDYEKSKTLSFLLQNIKPDGIDGYTDENWQTLLTATNDIESDFEMKKVMYAVAMTIPQRDALMTEAFKAMQSIQSDFELGELLSELVTNRPLEEPQFQDMLMLSTAIESDFELAELLVHIVKQVGLPGRTVNDWLESAKTIQSDFELARTLKALTATRMTEGALVNTIHLASEEIQSDFELAGFFKALINDQEISGLALHALNDSLREIQSDHERLGVIEVMRAKGL